MLRIAGVNIAPNQHIIIGLTGIFGIGRSRSKVICEEARILPSTKGKDITEDQAEILRKIITRFSVEGDLRREVHMHIKRLMDIGSYRGTRHKRGLPARGQRTRTNARTRKGGKRKVISFGRKE